MVKGMQKYLQDIINAIEEIDSFFIDRPKRFDNYVQELILRRAIERNIAIIGEAVNKAFQLDNNINIHQVRNIIATRNRIIHSYDSLLPELIWAIVINDLPILKQEVQTLLN